MQNNNHQAVKKMESCLMIVVSEFIPTSFR